MEKYIELIQKRISFNVGNLQELSVDKSRQEVLKLLLEEVSNTLKNNGDKPFPMSNEIDSETEPLSRIFIKNENGNYIIRLYDIRETKKTINFAIGIFKENKSNI